MKKVSFVNVYRLVCHYDLVFDMVREGRRGERERDGGEIGEEGGELVRSSDMEIIMGREGNN